MVGFSEGFRTVFGPNMYEFAEKNGAIASFVGCAEKAVKIRVFGAGWRFPEVFHDFGGERGGRADVRKPLKNKGRAKWSCFSDVFERLSRPKKGHISREKPEKQFFPSNICKCVFFSKKTPKKEGSQTSVATGKSAKFAIFPGFWVGFSKNVKRMH